MKLSEHFVALLFDDDCTWVEIFVNSVTEAHQATIAILVFYRVKELGAIVSLKVDFLKHF